MQIRDSGSPAGPEHVFDGKFVGPRLPLVRDLSPAQQTLVLAAGETETIVRGAVFYTGERARDWVYYLVKGKITTTGIEGQVHEFEAEASALVLECFHFPGRRCLSARALSEATIFRIPVVALGRYVNLANLMSSSLPDVAELGSSDDADGLELALSIGILSRLAPSAIQGLLQRVDYMPVHEGQFVVVQGREADACFILKAGTASVDVEAEGTLRRGVSVLGPGDFFGEEALLSGDSRRATVRMETDGELVRIKQVDLKRFIVPAYVRPVMRLAAETMVADGAIWLDMREAVQFNRGSIPGAINVPLQILRLRATGLSPESRYVVFGDTPGGNALGNFMLSLSGHDAYCLNEPFVSIAPPSGSDFFDALETTLQAGAPMTRPVAVEDEEDGASSRCQEDPDVSTRQEAPKSALDTLRAAERQRYQRRLRKAIALLRAELDAQVSHAVQEVERRYLAELESKHRQLLALKRKVAQQQRLLWSQELQHSEPVSGGAAAGMLRVVQAAEPRASVAPTVDVEHHTIDVAGG